MAPTVLHVRAETKPLEHRSAVTPSVAKKLVDAGYVVNVERSPLSIFDDSEYNGTGATLVPTESWTEAPSDHIIVGLKELPEEDFPLKHIHVQFAHCKHLHLVRRVRLMNNLRCRLQGSRRLGQGPQPFP